MSSWRRLDHHGNVLPEKWTAVAIVARSWAKAAERVDRYEPTPDEERSWLDEPWEAPPAEHWVLPRRATSEAA